MLELKRLMALKIVPFTYRSSLFLEAVRVYVKVWHRDGDDSIAFFRKYTQFPYYYGYVAQIRQKVVGMTFGTQSLPGQWWHDKVAAEVGKDHPALQNAWVLTELAVLKAYRNYSIGALLLDHVLEAQPFPNALLSTQVSNTDAQRFYIRHGWRMLHSGFSFNRGNEPYVIMHKVMKPQE